MRRIAHVSDLHFGRVDERLVRALATDLLAYEPHVVAVTGDLTQRAKRAQFEAASRFLASLPCPAVVIPGNHDIAPFHAPVERLLRPFARYDRQIRASYDPCYSDDELVVIGLNTADPLQRKEGKVRRRQIEWLCSLARRHQQAFPILLTHHPVVGKHVGPRGRAPLGSPALLRAVDRAGIKLVLAGHLHETFSGTYAARVGARHSVLVVQASTATSTRLRGQPNAYNRIHISGAQAKIEVRVWSGNEFTTDKVSYFEWQGDEVKAIIGALPERSDSVSRESVVESSDAQG